MLRCVALLLTFTALSASASDRFVSVAIGEERSGPLVLRDVDCGSTTPPALFGCVDGSDGRSLAARGEALTPVIEATYGVTLSDRLRAGVTGAWRGAAEFDATANFVGVTGEQPVHAEVESASLLAMAMIDVSPSSWRIRPFITAGAGAVRNSVSDVRYRFPSISPASATVTQGGVDTSFAWSAGAGAAVALTPSLSLDLSWRYSDLGEIRTDAGTATITRPGRLIELEIAGTRSELTVNGVTVGLRCRLGR
jgi:opacity protein-like surface antigen